MQDRPSDPSELYSEGQITTVESRTQVEIEGCDCIVAIYSPDPALFGKRYVLEAKGLQLGRGSENDLTLNDDIVSRVHAMIERRQSGWFLVDNRSTNGTFVNDERMGAPFLLKNGDRLKIGKTIFKFLSGEDVEAKYHEEIYRLSVVDGLTGAYGRKYLLERLELELTRLRRGGGDFTFLMLDIDHFKLVNDDFGHLAGDQVLRDFAGLVQGGLEGEQFLSRYGGEEFALGLPGIALAQSTGLAEGIRARTAARAFVFQKQSIPVTVSVGCTQADPSDSPQSLIRRADELLYEAKRQGRNRVIVQMQA